MDPMAAIRETYFQECGELLAVIEQTLLALQDAPDDTDAINAVFRAVHSIKGGGGAFRLDQLVHYAHAFESTLDDLRAGRLELTTQLVRLLLRAADLLSDLVRAAQDEVLVDQSHVDDLLAELSQYSGDQNVPQEAPEDDVFGFEPVRVDFPLEDISASSPSEPVAYSFSLRVDGRLYANGNEVTRLLSELGKLGTLNVRCMEAETPMIEELQLGVGFLEWRGELTTARPLDEILGIFEFVEDCCEIEFHPNIDHTSSSVGVSSCRAETADDIATARERRANPRAEPERPAVATQAPSAKSAKAESKGSIRVDLDRVDRLINLVGELVINQSMLAQSVSESDRMRRTAIMRGLDDLEQLTRDIQDCVMAIRAQPVRSLFQRMSRVVREVEDATGKIVRLETEGDATEIDRTVIERLSDPLTHMIRNAVDHGLESVERRRQAGKPDEGVITLSAAHRSGRVIIEVSDDGGGIDRDNVRRLAQAKGLIAADAQLSDSEIDNLLFLPGFSTSRKVSDISGRGVGLDVFKSSIQALGGRISISSSPGSGTTFSLSVPLTLAVVDGMIVHSAGQTLVVPLTAIVESIKPAPADIHPIGVSGLVLTNRGQFTPIIDVAHQLGYRDARADPMSGVLLLVESESGARSALLVDAIHDQRQVVIKSLEENYGRVPGIAAATILGDGHVALILDVDAIVVGTARAATSSQGVVLDEIAPC